MRRFLVKRVLQAAVVMLGVTAIVFVIVFLSGDPVYLMLPSNATTEDADLLRQQLGLNDPIYIQYARFLLGLLHGDFGTSLRFHSPALPLLLERLPATFQLAGTALLLSLLIAIPTGILAAVKKDTPLDLGAMLVALFGQSMPSFWLGLMLILFFAVHLGWFPSSGRTGPESVVLPAITLALFFAGRLARITRSSMLEVLHEDYVRTARAKGLQEWVVINKHALKNAALPVVTIIGLEFGALLSGAVVTETVFSWPGVASLAVNAVSWRDFPLVQAIVVFMALIFAFVNLAVDLVYVTLDPRIRYS